MLQVSAPCCPGNSSAHANYASPADLGFARDNLHYACPCLPDRHGRGKCKQPLLQQMSSVLPLAPGHDCCLSLLGLCKLAPFCHHSTEQLQFGLLDPLGYQAVGAVLPVDLLSPTDEHCTHLLIGQPVDGNTCMSDCSSSSASKDADHDVHMTKHSSSSSSSSRRSGDGQLQECRRHHKPMGVLPPQYSMTIVL